MNPQPTPTPTSSDYNDPRRKPVESGPATAHVNPAAPSEKHLECATAEDCANYLEKKSRLHWEENGRFERDTNSPYPREVVEYCDMLSELADELRALRPSPPSVPDAPEPASGEAVALAAAREIHYTRSSGHERVLNSADIIQKHLSAALARGKEDGELLAELNDGRKVTLPKSPEHAYAMKRVAEFYLSNVSARPTPEPKPAGEMKK